MCGKANFKKNRLAGRLLIILLIAAMLMPMGLAYASSGAPVNGIAARVADLRARHSHEGALELYLHSVNPEENRPFNVANMFPGDSIQQNYRLRVAYRGVVAVKFRAYIKPGYEKLAEVLKCRVELDGDTLYDGLMKDMPSSLDHMLNSGGREVTDLFYEITAYLDTSVGNEYQNKELYADFRWWAEGVSCSGGCNCGQDCDGENDEEGKLATMMPFTGDNPRVLLWCAIAIVSLLAVILMLVKRRKEERNERG